MLYQTTNPHGGDRFGRAVRLDFSVNTNPLGPPPAVVRAVEDAAGRLDQYPDPACRALVSALAAHEGVREEQILCGGGAAELIYGWCAALRPRRALMPAPTFSEYAAALEAAGCAVERWELKRSNGFQPWPDLLEHLEYTDYDAIFLCSPNNPTGQLLDRRFLIQLLGVCRRRGVRVFLDECFLELSDAGREAGMAAELEKNPGLFILRAFTKTYAMAGLRLGYCLTADRELLEKRSAMVQPWNVSLPAQKAGLAALGERDYLDRARALIRTERPFLEAGLEKLGLWTCPSSANYLLFYSEKPLWEPLLQRGILIRDCANYRGLGPGWYRVAVRRHEENGALLAALAEIVKGG